MLYERLRRKLTPITMSDLPVLVVIAVQPLEGIGGVQFMGWLETCVKEDFSVDITGPSVEQV